MCDEVNISDIISCFIIRKNLAFIGQTASVTFIEIYKIFVWKILLGKQISQIQ